MSHYPSVHEARNALSTLGLLEEIDEWRAIQNRILENGLGAPTEIFEQYEDMAIDICARIADRSAPQESTNDR